ncbi:MAG: hypothetical protein IV100_22785 [Myxococcales bacterium]|nr:hypothetical protein [Myxococcales bacterium]
MPEFGVQPPGDNRCDCSRTHQCTAGCAPQFWAEETPSTLADYCFESLGLVPLGGPCNDDAHCIWPSALRSPTGDPTNVYRRCVDSVCVESTAPDRLADGTRCYPRLQQPCGQASQCVQTPGSVTSGVCRHYCAGDHQCEPGFVCNLERATCYEP